MNARHGIGRREPVGRLRSSALDALAIAAPAGPVELSPYDVSRPRALQLAQAVTLWDRGAW